MLKALLMKRTLGSKEDRVKGSVDMKLLGNQEGNMFTNRQVIKFAVANIIQ